MQGLDWSNDVNIRKQILGFYSKAKDFKRMSAFYATMAQTEIDANHDYSKASAFLNDGLKVLQKGGLEISPEYSDIEKRIECIRQFDSVKQMSPEDQVQACGGFLATEGVDDYIRRGDIYALMISAFLHLGNEGEAAQRVVEMGQHKIHVQSFIPGDILQRLTAVGQQMQQQQQQQEGSQEEVYMGANLSPGSHEIDEDIDEELSDS